MGPNHPLIHMAPGALSRGAVEPEREADHSPFSVEVQNTWCCAYTPAICPHIMHRGNVLQSKSSLVVFHVAYHVSVLLTLTAWVGRLKTGHLVWIS
jgi:hypothetical protein